MSERCKHCDSEIPPGVDDLMLQTMGASIGCAALASGLGAVATYVGAGVGVVLSVSMWRRERRRVRERNEARARYLKGCGW